MGEDPFNKEESLDRFSSTDVIHDGSESVSSDEAIEIPSYYGQNRITLLPVNSEKQFFYWELTEEFLQSKVSKVVESFKVKVLLNGKSSEEYIVHGRVGDYYTKICAPFANLQLELLTMDNQLLMSSNQVVLASNTLHEPTREVWMTKRRGEILTKRFSGTLSHDNVLNSGESFFGDSSAKNAKWQRRSVSVSAKDIFRENSVKESLSSLSLSSSDLLGGGK